MICISAVRESLAVAPLTVSTHSEEKRGFNAKLESVESPSGGVPLFRWGSYDEALPRREIMWWGFFFPPAVLLKIELLFASDVTSHSDPVFTLDDICSRRNPCFPAQPPPPFVSSALSIIIIIIMIYIFSPPSLKGNESWINVAGVKTPHGKQRCVCDQT